MKASCQDTIFPSNLYIRRCLFDTKANLIFYKKWTVIELLLNKNCVSVHDLYTKKPHTYAEILIFCTKIEPKIQALASRLSRDTIYWDYWWRMPNAVTIPAVSVRSILSENCTVINP